MNMAPSQIVSRSFINDFHNKPSMNPFCATGVDPLSASGDCGLRRSTRPEPWEVEAWPAGDRARLVNDEPAMVGRWRIGQVPVHWRGFEVGGSEPRRRR